MNTKPVVIALTLACASSTARAFDPETFTEDPALFADLAVQDYQSLATGAWQDWPESAPWVLDDLAYWGTFWPDTGWCIPGMDSSPPCGGTNVYLASAIDLHIEPLVAIDRIGFDVGTQASELWVEITLSDATVRTFHLASDTLNPWGSFTPKTGFFGYGTGDPTLTIEHVWVSGFDGGIDDMRYGVVATTGICDDFEAAIRDLALAKGLENSLLAKLEAADRQIERGNVGAAVNILEALVNELVAQSGKGIDEDDAADLIACIEARIDALVD